MCTNFDVNKRLIIVILPIGVSSLGVQVPINSLISSILFSILISVISFILFTLTAIPRDVNSDVQINFRSLQNVLLLSPQTPILIFSVFSILIFNPEICQSI